MEINVIAETTLQESSEHSVKAVGRPGSRDMSGVLSHSGIGSRWSTAGLYVQVTLARCIVTAYKFAGLFILAAILTALFSYMFLTLFFTLSTRWMEPQVISPSDERVLRLSDELAQSTLLREKLVAQRGDVRARLSDAQRVIASSRDYQRGLSLAMRGSYQDHKHELESLKDLTRSFTNRGTQFAGQGESFITSSRQELETMHKAHLIDENAYMAGAHQLAQFENENLTMQKTAIELQNKLSELHREVDALAVVTTTMQRGGAAAKELSPDAVRVKREYDSASIEVNRAMDTETTLKGQLASFDGAIKRQDVISSAIANSAYIRAAQESLTVAFVPYANARDAAAGAPIYGCQMRVLWCPLVGRVTATLEGEVVGKYPFRGKETRGILVQMDVRDPRWVHSELLFVGKPALWLPW